MMQRYRLAPLLALAALAVPPQGSAQDADAPPPAPDCLASSQQVAAIGRRAHDPWIMLGAATLLTTPGCASRPQAQPLLQALLGQAQTYAWGNKNVELAIARVRAQAAGAAQ